MTPPSAGTSEWTLATSYPAFFGDDIRTHQVYNYNDSAEDGAKLDGPVKRTAHPELGL